MIAKVSTSTAYSTWNQIGESGLQRAQRSGVAKG
jgi:hypothetical protein